ncbi:unnamed protein product [Prorocentrum cordatum]|uniref:Uncharacterized protein n=1 Tax=Prorocentrum cordatum TaxID=2364126 RepID=A0ABN9QXV7_9DINO|nr:unnamed protein product [Polarella glacialis]
MSGHGRRGRGDGPRPRLAAGRRWQERRRRRRRACGAGGHGTTRVSQARRPAPSAGMGSAARAGAARALEEARRAAKETVFLWAAFWRSSRQRGKRCPSLVARHGYGKTGTLPRNKWATIRHGPPARHDALRQGGEDAEHHPRLEVGARLLARQS